jgi:hypothetical protein
MSLASEMRALKTQRSREAFGERAAERRSPKAGHTWATNKACWRRRGADAEQSSSGCGAGRAAGPAASASQKETSTPDAAKEVGRVAAKAAQSARQAVVRSSPTQQEAMRAPVGVQPGHWPLRVWYLIGHSKGRWARPGKATEMEQEHNRPCAMTARPRLVPTMRAETGLPT